MNELPELCKHPKQLIENVWRAGAGDAVNELINPANGAVLAR